MWIPIAVLSAFTFVSNNEELHSGGLSKASAKGSVASLVYQIRAMRVPREGTIYTLDDWVKVLRVARRLQRTPISKARETLSALYNRDAGRSPELFDDVLRVNLLLATVFDTPVDVHPVNHSLGAYITVPRGSETAWHEFSWPVDWAITPPQRLHALAGWTGVGHANSSIYEIMAKYLPMRNLPPLEIRIMKMARQMKKSMRTRGQKTISSNKGSVLSVYLGASRCMKIRGNCLSVNGAKGGAIDIALLPVEESSSNQGETQWIEFQDGVS